MVTTQVALNGLQRGLTYVQYHQNSDSKLYSKGAKHIESIRNMALEILKIADNLLETKTNYENHSFDESEISKIADLVVEKISTKIPQQISEIPAQIGEKVQKISENRKKNTFSKDFKSVISETTKNSSEDIKEYSEICENYFKVRFSPKNDPKNIHKFSMKSYTDYLKALILSISECEVAGVLEEFKVYINNWLSEVKKGNIKYTFPKPVAGYFYTLNGSDTEHTIPQSVYEKASEIWNKLWESGFNEFDSLKDKHPNFKLPSCDAFN